MKEGQWRLLHPINPEVVEEIKAAYLEVTGS